MANILDWLAGPKAKAGLPGMKGARGCRGVAEYTMTAGIKAGEKRRGLCQLDKGHEGSCRFVVEEGHGSRG